MIKIKDEPVTKSQNNVTPITKVTKTTMAALRLAIARGRPRKHGTAAERQKAYRSREEAPPEGGMKAEWVETLYDYGAKVLRSRKKATNGQA